MIAGMLSKATLRPADLGKMATRLLLPLLIFQCLYVGLVDLRAGHHVVSLLRPYWILWFLLSLICWRLMLPVFARILLFVALAFAIALAAGFSKHIGYALSLSRTLYFFPFFLIGYAHGKKIVAFADAHRSLLALVFLLGVAAGAWWSLSGLPYAALYGSLGYADVAAIAAMPAIGRALVLALSSVCAVGALALFRFRQPGLVKLGQRSLSVFVLHGFAVMGLAAVINRLHVEPSALLMPAWFAIALAIAVTTSLLDPWLNRLYDAVGKRLRLSRIVA